MYPFDLRAFVCGNVNSTHSSTPQSLLASSHGNRHDKHILAIFFFSLLFKTIDDVTPI